MTMGRYTLEDMVIQAVLSQVGNLIICLKKIFIMIVTLMILLMKK